jgi:hypothetical protein
MIPGEMKSKGVWFYWPEDYAQAPVPINTRGKHIPIKIIENPFTLDLVLIVHS